MSGKIVLGEGTNDLVLLTDIFNQHDSSVEIDTLNLEGESGSNRNPKESEKIRNFNERFNPYDVLIKAEGGKPNLKDAFCSFAKALSRMDCEVCIVFDLDGGEIRDAIDEINEKLQGIYRGNQVQIEEIDTPTETDAITARTCSIIVNGRNIDDFNMIAFSRSLEDEAGIDHDENREEIEDKIEQVIDDNEIFNPITKTVF